RGVKATQRRSEAGFSGPGRQGTRDAESRHVPEPYQRPRRALRGQSQRDKGTGEPDDATSIQSGSAGGWEKRPKGPRSQPTQLQSSRSTFSRGSLLSFFAFKEGMLGIPISVLGGWPTVSGGNHHGEHEAFGCLEFGRVSVELMDILNPLGCI